MNDKVQRGDIIELVEGQKVYADVPRHLVFANCLGDWRIVHHDVTIGGDFAYLAGQYAVINTVLTGGSPSLSDGHHVFCRRMKEGSWHSDLDVDFYQENGCWTACIPNPTVIGKAKINVVSEEPGDDE